MLFTIIKRLTAVWVAGAALFLGGCETTNLSQGKAPSPGDSTFHAADSDRLQKGDLIRIEFSETTRNLTPHEEVIKDDGTIFLNLVGSITAAGKTPGELQKEIREKYLKYYKQLAVVVQAPQRFFSVGGEVKSPMRQIYIGGMTVVGAIQSVGDFTEFANKRKVMLTRANGQNQVVDCIKARKDAKADLPVYPGDKIHVPRRTF